MNKTWQALDKRITITKTKKMLKKKAGQNHFNTKERGITTNGKRRLVRAPHSLKNLCHV